MQSQSGGTANQVSSSRRLTSPRRRRSEKTSPGQAPVERLRVCPATTFRQLFRHASPNPGASRKSWLERSFDNAALTLSPRQCPGSMLRDMYRASPSQTIPHREPGLREAEMPSVYLHHLRLTYAGCERRRGWPGTRNALRQATRTAV